MSRTGLATMAVGAILALACGDATGPDGIGAEGHAPRFAATHFTATFVFPVDELFPVPCANGGAGEEVRITGSNTITVKETVSSSGNRILRVHLQPDDLMGVGQSSGDIYRVSRSPGQIIEVEQSDDFPFVTTVLPQPIVLRGERPKAGTILIHTRFRLVIDNNGTVRVFLLDFSATCQGPGR